MPDATIYTKIA